MSKENLPEKTPETKTGENQESVQDYIAKLREAGLTVIDTTRPGAATIFVGGVRKPKQSG